MADNTTAAAGPTIATDDVGGVHYQRVKLDLGADGEASPAIGTVPVSGTVAVTGAYQATQPVSIASMPATPVTGTFWQTTQPVSGTVGVSGSVAVTGSFYQATQPVSGTVTVGNASLAVTGSFYPATQPVSGTFWQATQPVSIASMPSTPVTGTFWPATQPVSGTVTVGNSSLAVTGTFWQATQPVSIAATVAVSGPLTDAQLRASPLPVSGTFNASPTPEASATFRGRALTFRTPGRAGTTGQKILALHNATGSTKVVHVNQVTVDLYQTVIKAVTVPPPVIRVHRFTVLPTNGTALTKVSKDTSLTSNSSITAWGDASADGTGSATTLTVTIPANSALTQEYAPRLITAAGYEMFDRTEMLVGYDIVLRPLEGIVVNLDYTVATQNPITDMWVASVDWWEI